jgi:hypothetical protein
MTVAFIPLFIIIVVYMKLVSHPDVFAEIKCKTITLFTVYDIILVGRLLVYFDIIIPGSILPPVKVDPELPLYITEILMTLMIIYMMLLQNQST